MKEIKEKIVGQRVLSAEAISVDKESQWQQKLEENPQLKKDFESLSSPIAEIVRPRRIGNTWRLKPPYAEHALYVTIEAITVTGKKYPYEVFFHGKDISHRQWTDTLTLSWSESFRKAIDYGFSLTSLISNIQDTNSAEGGYRTYLKEGDAKPTYVKGLVSEIGYVLEEFVKECLAFNYSHSTYEVLPTEAEKEAAFMATAHGVPYQAKEMNAVQKLREFAKDHMLNLETVKPQEYMPHWKEPLRQEVPLPKEVKGSRCAKCGEYAVVNQGGCTVCLECSDTKCE